MRARLVLVLGMHRSGTSVVTRALRVFGVDIGSTHLARADNPLGFYEYPPLVRLNERLLATLGLDWTSVEGPSLSDCARLRSGPLGDMGRDLLRSFTSRSRLTGLKDPRLCRLLPFWRPLCETLGLSLSCIISLRAPAQVASSLEARDHLPSTEAQALWSAYVADALVGTQGLSRLLLSYDRLLEKPCQELARMGQFLGLPVQPSEATVFVETFLQPHLRHHTADGDEASSKDHSDASTLYALLAPLTRGVDAHTLDEPALRRRLLTLARPQRG